MLKNILYCPQELSPTSALFTLKRSSCCYDDLQTASILSIHPMPYFIHPVFGGVLSECLPMLKKIFPKSTFNRVIIWSKIFAGFLFATKAPQPYIQDPLQITFLTYLVKCKAEFEAEGFWKFTFIQSCKTVLCPPKNYMVPIQPYPTQSLMTDKRNSYQTYVWDFVSITFYIVRL